jgi:hypothetical protein
MAATLRFFFHSQVYATRAIHHLIVRRDCTNQQLLRGLKGGASELLLSGYIPRLGV